MEYIKPIDITDVIGKPLAETMHIKRFKHEKKAPISKYKLPVYQFTRNGEFLRRYDCINDAAAELGIMGKVIARASRGEQKTAGGYIWRREMTLA